jgi:transcriptional regulator GlxA family with amidase domain
VIGKMDGMENGAEIRHEDGKIHLYIEELTDWLAEIRKVEGWLGTHWNQAVAAAEMAAIARLSERQLVRRFKAATGKTSIEYLQNLRINQARHLLETTPRR